MNNLKKSMNNLKWAILNLKRCMRHNLKWATLNLKRYMRHLREDIRQAKVVVLKDQCLDVVAVADQCPEWVE
jgi:hypothetical protein